MIVLALNCGSPRKYVGADLAPLHGADAVVFSGGLVVGRRFPGRGAAASASPRFPEPARRD